MKGESLTPFLLYYLLAPLNSPLGTSQPNTVTHTLEPLKSPGQLDSFPWSIDQKINTRVSSSSDTRMGRLRQPPFTHSSQLSLFCHSQPGSKAAQLDLIITQAETVCPLQALQKHQTGPHSQAAAQHFIPKPLAHQTVGRREEF